MNKINMVGLDRKKRFMSILIDFSIIGGSLSFFLFILFSSFTEIESVLIFFASVFLINLVKDVDNGQSIGKRILKIRIVKLKDGESPTSMQTIVRNLTFVIWPVEIIMLLINPQKRIGDYFARTQVRICEQENDKPVNLKEVFIIYLYVVLTFAISGVGLITCSS